ncbi:glycosyltransferase family 2 protein, partial [Neobacillus niacini]
MSNAKVAISIVTYNSQHIFKVLENLKEEFCQDNRFRFVIFDNNSNEDYKNQLKKYQDFADINFNQVNNGFG